MSTLPIINFEEFDVDNIIECLENSGYICNPTEFQPAKDGLFKYIGYSNNCHRFLIGFENDTEPYLVTRLFITLGLGGKLTAEYRGEPEFEGTLEEAEEYVEKRCN